MNSGAPTSPKKGGGILRSRKHKDSNGHSASEPAPNRVTFSAPTPRAPSDGDESDDVEDAVLASGEVASLGMGGHRRRDGPGDASDGDGDAAVPTTAEIDQARRRRGRVRRREEQAAGAAHADADASEDDQCASLITNRDADPDAYESNASENAVCPVEPFNMEAEKESGLGYFDGETFVFRQGGKPVDGEEDAWLDGVGDEEGREGTSAEGGVGGLDATAVWKPRPAGTAQYKGSSRKSSFVDEEATPEDLARRVAVLLERDDETIMMALTRHGASLRKLQAQARKMIQKPRSKGRRPSQQQGSKEVEDNGPLATTASSSTMADRDEKDLKSKMKVARTAVEELTELADALLFGGEADAYDRPRRDWIRRFGLERHFSPAPTKRPPAPPNAAPAKKKSRGYFDAVDPGRTEGGAEKTENTEPETPGVTWEYRGNEDGAVHGPYTSRQMLEWTSSGYFVGESAVDVRCIGGNHIESPEKDEMNSGSGDGETDKDELLADLLEDDENEEDTKAAAKTATRANVAHGSASWMRSDKVDFRSYL